MTAHRPTSKEINAAALQEQQAYQELRDLVPDLHLRVEQRAPLNREQANAVTNYEHARERVRLLRSWYHATRPDGELGHDTSDLDPED